MTNQHGRPKGSSIINIRKTKESSLPTTSGKRAPRPGQTITKAFFGGRKRLEEDEDDVPEAPVVRATDGWSEMEKTGKN